MALRDQRMGDVMNSLGRRDMILGASALITTAASPASPGTRVALRLLETSDLHAYVYDYDYFHTRDDPTVGLAKIATLIRAARAEAANTMLFDNGDIIQGSPLGDFETRPDALPAGVVHPMFRAMNLLEYDAATLGNHEFNYGLDFLARAIDGAAFPFVCANLDHADGRTYVRRSIVLRKDVTAADGTTHTLRVGVIGFLPPQIMVWDRSKLEGQVKTTDIIAAAERDVPALRAASDIVVALCHSGISTSPHVTGGENASFHLAHVPGIDAIFTGHSHRLFPGPDYAGRAGVDAVRGTLNGVPAVMPGFWGSHLGVIDLALVRDETRWNVADFKVEARPIYRRDPTRLVSLVDDDPAILDAVAPEHRATIAWMAQPVGNLVQPLTSFFALSGDDRAVALVNDAQRWYAAPLLAGTPLAALALLSAAAPFKFGYSPQNYVDLPAGPIALKDVADIYGYPNTVCVVRVTGAGLREWLEKSAGVFNRIDPARADPQDLIDIHVPAYNFDVIAGVTYRIDLTRPARYNAAGEVVHPDARRIVDLRYASAPIDPAASFLVVTNNYRADGGGRFPGLRGGEEVVLRAPDTNRDAVQRYIAQRGTVDPAPGGTWSFAPIGHAVTVVFDSAPGAAATLAAHPGVRSFGDGRNGFARYAMDLA